MLFQPVNLATCLFCQSQKLEYELNFPFSITSMSAIKLKLANHCKIFFIIHFHPYIKLANYQNNYIYSNHALPFFRQLLPVVFESLLVYARDSAKDGQWFEDQDALTSTLQLFWFQPIFSLDHSLKKHFAGGDSCIDFDTILLRMLNCQHTFVAFELKTQDFQKVN